MIHIVPPHREAMRGGTEEDSEDYYIMENANYKSGFVTLIGRPNVGKSTLMNHLIGQKIAITSNKPQTTRNRIQTVYTSEQGQIIFLDTPGIHKAKNKLGEYMVTAAEQTLKEVDVVLWLVEPTDTVGKGDLHIAEKLRSVHVPVILVLNKMDTVDKREIPRYLDVYRELFDFADAIPVCALRGLHMEKVIQAIFRYLPYGPQYYDEDTVTDQPQRQIVAELIREKALRCMEEEIPHGIAVSIEYMEERPAGSEKKKTNRAEAARKRNRHTHVHDRHGKGSDAANGQSGGEVDKSDFQGTLVRGLAEKTGKPGNTDKLRKESAEATDKSGNIDSTRKGSVSANGKADDAARAGNVVSAAGPGKFDVRKNAAAGNSQTGSSGSLSEKPDDAELGRRGRAEVRLREDSDWIMDIEATIICEKESHKGMVIGKQGAMLRKIGSQARYEIEQMLEEPVNLQLWVKVKKDWRDSDYMIKNFGYDKKELE